MKLELVIASTNNNKTKEYSQMSDDILFSNASDYKISLKDVIENGNDYHENAYLKARYLKDKIDRIVIADDSGLEIEALPNILGIHTARYLENLSYKERSNKILELLKDKDNRTAYFKCTICLILKDNTTYYFDGVCKGHISYSYEGNNGFGYDPIFICDGYDKTMASLDDDTKNMISHRGLAFKKLKQFLIANGYLKDVIL